MRHYLVTVEFRGGGETVVPRSARDEFEAVLWVERKLIPSLGRAARVKATVLAPDPPDEDEDDDEPKNGRQTLGGY